MPHDGLEIEEAPARHERKNHAVRHPGVQPVERGRELATLRKPRHGYGQREHQMQGHRTQQRTRGVRRKGGTHSAIGSPDHRHQSVEPDRHHNGGARRANGDARVQCGPCEHGGGDDGDAERDPGHDGGRTFVLCRRDCRPWCSIAPLPPCATAVSCGRGRRPRTTITQRRRRMPDNYPL